MLSENEAEAAPALAVTTYEPAVALAVAVTLATPAALVTAVGLDSVALAPLPGAVKETVTPLNRLPPESFTVACNAPAKTALVRAVCGVPAGVIVAGSPAVFVRIKKATRAPSVPGPPVLAVTV